MGLQENLNHIQQNIKKFGKSSVRICGVVKKQDPSVIEQAIELGLTDLGVNYAQEGEAFRQLLPSPSIHWHFIGHIQSRKVKIVAEYDLVESLDSMDIATALNQRVEPMKKVLPVLVQVNIGEEPQKSGIAVGELDGFLKNLKALKFLKVTGLMALPPGLADVEQRRPYFKKMRRLYDEYAQQFPFEVLSMGTSEDYLIALQEGANLIRLGTVLFGSRTA